MKKLILIALASLFVFTTTQAQSYDYDDDQLLHKQVPRSPLKYTTNPPPEAQETSVPHYHQHLNNRDPDAQRSFSPVKQGPWLNYNKHCPPYYRRKDPPEVMHHTRHHDLNHTHHYSKPEPIQRPTTE